MSKIFRRVSYLYFGRPLEPLIERGYFQTIGLNLQKGGVEISLRGYVGMAVFSAILTFIASSIIVALLGVLIDPVLIIIAIPAGIIMGFLALLPFQFYPSMKASERKVLLEGILPTTASYMSAMASAGVPPSSIFQSLAGEETTPIMSHEAKRITRDIEIFGFDILKALSAASSRSPSERFSTFLEGIIATITSGGDLTYYLASETKDLMKYKEDETRAFIDQLGVMAEIFMVLGVVTPLFFVIMIAILSVTGGGSGTQGRTLLLFLTYLLMPMAMAGMVLMIGTAERE